MRKERNMKNLIPLLFLKKFENIFKRFHDMFENSLNWMRHKFYLETKNEIVNLFCNYVVDHCEVITNKQKFKISLKNI